ncbi:hypothetical protein [Ideonella sp.]|uniref:hypothetical protein n=1 Tax=Ideonella sp. TaxID=1929293 RepID=UPI003BB809B9
MNSSSIFLSAAALLAGALAPLACAAPLPRSADIRYDVKWGMVSLEALQQWRLEGTRYTLTTELKLPLAFKNRRYISQGLINDQGLATTRYDDFQVGEDSPRNQAVLDRSAQELRYGTPGKQRSLPLQAGLQDLHSLAYQLMWLGDAVEGASIPVTNGKGVVQHRFQSALPQAMKIDDMAVVTRRWVSSSSDGSVEVWLAPAFAQLPVTVIRSQDGRSLRFVAREVRFSP